MSLARYPDSAGPDSVYRAYTMNDLGRIDTAQSLQANSDQDAIAQARMLLDGHAIEVWDRGRFIVSLNPRPTRLFMTSPRPDPDGLHAKEPAKPLA